MRVIRSVASMQRLAMSWRRKGLNVAFVPTMGYLHAGHVSLMERARRLAGDRGIVVVSIYVNPTQFGPNEDFSRYPRNFPRDRRLCREASVDFLFAPTDQEMYPRSGNEVFGTSVVEENLTKVMEGASRPTHFRGVTTIVAKLFNIVQPVWAIFGAKDYQQAMVVQRMVRDLNFPVRIVVAPTKREADGLAMSSRNKYLSRDERQQAIVLWRAIRYAANAVKKRAVGIPSSRLQKKLSGFIQQQPAARVDYIAFFDPETLAPAATVKRGTHMALAVFVGQTRLIDNARL